MVMRSRYECDNDGMLDGIVCTHCDYLIGCGPKLRMLFDNQALNDEIELGWCAWAKAVKFSGAKVD